MWTAGKYQGTQVSPARAYLEKASLRQLNHSLRSRRPSRLLLSATRTTLRSVPSVFIFTLQAKIGQRFIWRIDSKLLALGGRLLSRQVVPEDPQKLSRKTVTRDLHELWLSRDNVECFEYKERRLPASLL